MMKKILICLILFGLSFNVIAADNPQTPTPPTPATPRVSIFSTTTDWAALTGLPLQQYVGNFTWKNSDVERGIVLY